MKYSLHIVVAFLSLNLSGCIINTLFSSEYSKEYMLANESILEPCSMFTNFTGLWFTGLDDVMCINPVHDQTNENVKYLPAGTTIKIVRLFKIGAVDAEYSNAEIEVIYKDNKVQKDVYIDWPPIEDFLVENK